MKFVYKEGGGGVREDVDKIFVNYNVFKRMKGCYIIVSILLCVVCLI